MPTSGKAAASTALPQPPSTSQNVPMNSATIRTFRLMSLPWVLDAFEHEPDAGAQPARSAIRPWSYATAPYCSRIPAAPAMRAASAISALTNAANSSGAMLIGSAPSLQPLAHVRRGDHAREVARDFLHHGGRRPGRRPQAVPERVLEARNAGLRDRRRAWSRAERCAELTASTRKRPSRMCGSARVTVLKVKLMRPAMVSWIASAPPL